MKFTARLKDAWYATSSPGALPSTCAAAAACRLRGVNVEFLPWAALDDAPETRGVYAWYHRPNLGNATVDGVINAVVQEDGLGTEAALRRIRAFLDVHIFARFRAPSYAASLTGPLRPTYEGQLDMASAVSDSLVQRIAADPQRLRGIATALKGMSPYFASPLYIGMAKRSLRERLAQHKARILEIAQARADLGALDAESQDKSPDASFALEVSRRGIPYTSLWVAVGPMPEVGEPVDIENVLNRLNHPLLGKN